MGLNHQSIRIRILVLITISLLALISVYLYAAARTVGQAVALLHGARVYNVSIQPATVRGLP